jgi:class 3 adenylate cyclase/tetratricopeptide (TPR) repeat protein
VALASRRVICGTCNQENPSTNKFCGNCGSLLSTPCPQCGASNDPASNFCGQCGSALTESASQPAPATAERRLVTVLFTDLTGFTSFSEGRDAEEVRSFQSAYYEESRRVMARFGGVIEKYIGDAVMAVWGAEIGSEDDAERAVRAGFELVDIVAKLSAEIGVPDLALRVGIHTGEAAVGPTDDHMGFVTGDLVNTASRLQSVAEPGTVLVGDPTYQAARQSIGFEAVAAQALKGKSLPVQTWRATRVLSERGGRGRSETLEPPFVGRGDELRLLKDLLHTVGHDSRARLVSLVGEAGIGKSRLVWEFEKYIDGLVDDIYWHAGRSPSYGDGITFWSIAEMVKTRARIVDTDSDDAVLAKLDDALEKYIDVESDRSWIRPRLSAVLGFGEAPGDRAELDAAVRAFFEGVSRYGTTVLVFEDLHWADTELIEFVEELPDWWRNRPILIVTMARPDLLERKPSWGTGRQGLVSLTLGPLSDEDMSDLVHGAVPGLPDHVATAIVEKSTGIPLYAVELLRGLLAQGQLAGESGAYEVVGDLEHMVVPESLQAVIGARLDRLDAEDRSLIQDAAVLGQSFTLSGLAAITGRTQSDLESQLQALTRRELVEPVRDPLSPESGQYRFLQGLIRDVALGRLSRDARRSRHLAVAEHLEAQEDPELAGIVASHFLQALEASPSGESRDVIRGRALVSMARAATRAADLKSSQQVLSISNTAIGIAEADEEKAPFWEMMVTAHGELADADSAESAALPAIAHFEATDDDEGLARTRYSLALQLVNNSEPERAVSVLQPWLESGATPANDPAVATARGLYGRILMLAQQPGALEALESSLPVLETHALTAPTVDALITKGTLLGREGRLTEARIILEGALALAERNELGSLLARAQNNLAYILVGIDDAASSRVSEDAWRTALRSGDRSMLMFQTGQRAYNMIYIGEFEAAEETLRHPLASDPPPAARAMVATGELIMAAWRGENDRVQELRSEIELLMPEVDDPQTRGQIEETDIEVALSKDDVKGAADICIRLLDREWGEVSDAVPWGIFLAALLGDRDLCAVLSEKYGRFHPRFAHLRRMAEIFSEGVPEDMREVDEIIASRIEAGVVPEVVLINAAAARFGPPDQSDRYLEAARSIAGDKGWSGILRLIDTHLS